MRDPRVEPKAGDVLSRFSVRAMGGFSIRKVRIVHRDSVMFIRESFGGSSVIYNSRSQWQRWAKKAEVLHVTD